MKLNWGVGIVIALVVFVGILTSLAVYFMNQDVDLVATNYYDKEISYQKDIDRMNETEKLNEPVTIKNMGNVVAIKFPKEVLNDNVAGSVHFYKPSDAKLDFKIDFELKADSMVIADVKKFSAGMWKAKIQWHTSKSKFYNEEIFYID